MFVEFAKICILEQSHLKKKVVSTQKMDKLGDWRQPIFVQHIFNRYFWTEIQFSLTPVDNTQLWKCWSVSQVEPITSLISMIACERSAYSSK